MTIEYRGGSEDDLPAIARLDGTAFGHLIEGEELDDYLSGTGLTAASFLLATDGGQVVGVAADYELRLTAVGGGDLDFCGLTWVSVSPTHRRRGILTELMRRKLADYRDRGRAAAGLIASEGGIYRRFGYGPATVVRRVRVDRRRAQLRETADAGQVRIATPEQARAAMPELHERWRRAVPGSIRRSPARWDQLVADRPGARGGRSALFYLLHDEGYAAFRAEQDWGHALPDHDCRLEQFAATTPGAAAALWQTMLGLDLYGHIDTIALPADDPLAELLTDARQVRTTDLYDGLWLRPLDVAALVRTRTYALEFEVVWQLRDPLLGDRRVRISGGPDGGACEPSTQTAQLESDVAAFASSWLGGTRLTALHRGERVVADTGPEHLGRLDRALLADRAPFHGLGF